MTFAWKCFSNYNIISMYIYLNILSYDAETALNSAEYDFIKKPQVIKKSMKII